MVKILKVNRWPPILMVLLGMVGLTISAISGKISFYLILIVPVLVGRGLLPVISFLSIISGLIWLTLRWGFVERREATGDERKYGGSEKEETSGPEAGGIIFIGPIPLVFGWGGFRKGLPGWRVLFFIGLFVFITFMIMSLLLIMFF